jgi:hypothetical protein
MEIEPYKEKYVTYVFEEYGQHDEFFPELPLCYILNDSCHVPGCSIIKTCSIQLYSCRL